MQHGRFGGKEDENLFKITHGREKSAGHGGVIRYPSKSKREYGKIVIRRAVKEEKGRGRYEMKLEKREITLNEKDSLQDARYMQKGLLSAYLQCLEQVERKEVRQYIQQRIDEIRQEAQKLEKQIEKL